MAYASCSHGHAPHEPRCMNETHITWDGVWWCDEHYPGPRGDQLIAALEADGLGDQTRRSP